MRVNCLTKKDLSFIVINNDANMEVTLSSLGASIYSIRYDNNIMSMTPIMLEDFLKDDVYYGKTIGRVAGRIKDGLVKINDQTYHLEQNEGETSLHGGKNGINTKIFKNEIEELPYGIKVTFKYLSKDLEANYPGNVLFKVIYFIHKDQAVLDLMFEIKTDQDTLISPTNHSYFVLGEKSLKECQLMIHANKFVEVDKDLMIPLRELEVKKCLDFKEFKDILEDIDDPYLMESSTFGYDHYFIFNQDHDQVSLKGKKYQLDIDTDMDGLQVYSHNYMDNILTIGSAALQYRGVALEPSLNPLKNRLLKKEETFKKYITYSFKKINNE